MEFIIDEFNRLVKVKNITKNDTKIIIPDGVEIIGKSCFFANRNIKEIVLPDSVKVIERMAFQECLYLNKINLPDSLKLIEEYAFDCCKSLKSINLPDSIINIENSAFCVCSQLESISLPINLTTIRYQLFSQCYNLKSIVLPKSIHSIEGLSFMDCSNIEKITCDNIFLLNNMHIKYTFEKLPFIYFNQDKESFIFSKESIEEEGYKEINYYETKKLLKCDNTIATLIALNFTTKDIKKAKSLKKIINDIIIDNYKPKHSDLLLKLKNNKEFENLIKHISKSKRIKSTPLYDIFKLAYSLGAFNENPIERQRACEFLANAFDKNMLALNKIHKTFKSMNFDGYKEEWASFFMNKDNFAKLLEKEKQHHHYISKIYNIFEEIETFGKSNKGKQRTRKVTIDMCEEYTNKVVFKNMNSSNIHIANALKKFTRAQDTFEEAIAIMDEYEQLKNRNEIHDHLLEEELKESVFSEIDKIKESILNDTSIILNNLDAISNKNFTYEFLAKNDPENLVLGKQCDCCGHLEAAGAGIAIAGVLHPNCQNIVIRNSEGTIISKSTIYLNRKQGYILLNTIQINSFIKGKEAHYLIYEKYIKSLIDFIDKYNKKNPTQPITQVNTGMNRNDLELIIRKKHNKSKNILKGINFSEFNNYVGHQGDWQKEQYVLWESKTNKKQVK